MYINNSPEAIADLIRLLQHGITPDASTPNPFSATQPFTATVARISEVRISPNTMSAHSKFVRPAVLYECVLPDLRLLYCYAVGHERIVEARHASLDRAQQRRHQFEALVYTRSVLPPDMATKNARCVITVESIEDRLLHPSR